MISFPLYHFEDASIIDHLIKPEQAWLHPLAKGIGIGIDQYKKELIWIVSIVRI